MASYTSGLLRNRIEILNRTEAQQGKFGLDSAGVTWASAGKVWAEVSWARGKQAMNVGAIDAYGVIMVRMRYTTRITERSRIIHEGRVYQILTDTFHADRQDNTIQLHAQQVVNDK